MRKRKKKIERRTRLAVQDVKEIKRLLNQGFFAGDEDCIAAAFECTLRTVRDMKARRVWKGVRAAPNRKNA